MCSDSLDMAGEVVQDLAAYLGALELPSTADFPLAMAAFKEVLNAVRRGGAGAAGGRGSWVAEAGTAVGRGLEQQGRAADRP